MNDKEVREMLENEQIPEELEPDRIKTMLDEKAPAAKRKKITAVSRFAAIAAACAVVSGTAVYVAGHGNNINKKKDSSLVSGTSSHQTGTSAAVFPSDNILTPDVPDPGTVTPAPYMSGAEDYGEIYELMRNTYEDFQKSNSRYIYFEDESIKGIDYAEETNGDTINGVPKSNGDAEPAGNDDHGAEHSDTFNQEEGVLEADIVKTDGKTIYCLDNSYYGDTNCVIKAVDVKDGKFGEVREIDVTGALRAKGNTDSRIDIYRKQLYLYNDMLIFIATYREEATDVMYRTTKNIYSKPKTAALAFSADSSHKLLGSYVQDGSFSDVRISPEGYLYIITDYSTVNITDINGKDDIEKYIPRTGDLSAMSPIVPADILMPECRAEPSPYLSYSVISSLDLNTSGSMTVSASKALAGYSGQIYCSAENLYTAAYDYGKYMFGDDEEVQYGFTTTRTTETELTRIAIKGGQITPVASGKIPGIVNDQFSMSEYNGHFRVAVTCSEYKMTYTKGEYYEYYEYCTDEADGGYGSYKELEEPKKVEYGYYDYDSMNQDNRVYVLDLDFNTVGSISGFGIDESVKSVNFNGDMAYVVTYEQTDPLFAIDLSDPSEPVILDELKMLGYSSYMQKWDDGLLLGFGPDADEKGRENGLKLAMFDNSDPNDLKLAGVYTISDDGSSWIYSSAERERKALFIHPEKNLVGFPVTIMRDDKENDWICQYSYKFFSYEDGKFVPKGEIVNNYGYSDLQYSINTSKYGEFTRALYIGDYIYAVSDTGLYSADMDTITVKDKVSFTD